MRTSRTSLHYLKPKKTSLKMVVRRASSCHRQLLQHGRRAAPLLPVFYCVGFLFCLFFVSSDVSFGVFPVGMEFPPSWDLFPNQLRG